MDTKRLQEIRDRLNNATKGPWAIWKGPEYEGGGADLCIGAGETWLANMDHRVPRCPQILDNGHLSNECDICSIDGGIITDEQRANAELIKNSPDDLRYLITEVERMHHESSTTEAREIARLTAERDEWKRLYMTADARADAEYARADAARREGIETAARCAEGYAKSAMDAVKCAHCNDGPRAGFGIADAIRALTPEPAEGETP